MTAIIQCGVFPNLDKVSPLNYPEEDEIPAKFGPDWLRYQSSKSQAPVDEEEEKKEEDPIVVEKSKKSHLFEKLIDDEGEIDD